MRSRKGEIILEEDSRQWNNSAIKRPRVAASTNVSFLFWRVTELQGMIENILCLQVFSLKVLKFDLYLSKQSISRALKRALKRAYLMIVGQSLHFTSCYWRCNLCTAIFHRRVWSMNSKEWLPKFYVFKFCSPTVFNFDFHNWLKRVFCELYRETFQRGACEACLQVVLSRTFPQARARSRSKFTNEKRENLQEINLDHLERKKIKQFCFGTLVRRNMT